MRQFCVVCCVTFASLLRQLRQIASLLRVFFEPLRHFCVTFFLHSRFPFTFNLKIIFSRHFCVTFASLLRRLLRHFCVTLRQLRQFAWLLRHFSCLFLNVCVTLFKNVQKIFASLLRHFARPRCLKPFASLCVTFALLPLRFATRKKLSQKIRDIWRWAWLSLWHPADIIGNSASGELRIFKRAAPKELLQRS